MYILISIFIILAIFYFKFLIQIIFGLKKIRNNYCKGDEKPFVSIIVPFRNESEVIVRCLKSLEAQNYPQEKYEILFIDDLSIDDSIQKIISAKQLSTTQILSVPNDFQKMSPKKRSIKFGVEKAKGEIIFTTDADCTNPKEWIAKMVSAFDEDTGLISAPVKFSESGNLFGKIQQLEFGGLVLSGAGLIGAGKPTISNAANIAFKKEAFNFVGGYDDNQHLASGDDEFLMQKIAKSNKYRVKFLFDANVVVETNPNKTLNGFIQQRKRWASKGLFYNDKRLILKLILLYLFFLSLPIQLILGLSLNRLFIYSFAVSVLIKMVFEYIILRKGVQLLYSKMEFSVFVLSEILHIPYIILAAFAGAFGNFEWKGRELKR